MTTETNKLVEMALSDACEKGWCAAAQWASRDDLRHDITSPAYLTQRDHDLAALATQAQGQDAAPADQAQLPKSWADAIDYPRDWDTAAYPTLQSAVQEVLIFGRCSVCAARAKE